MQINIHLNAHNVKNPWICQIIIFIVKFVTLINEVVKSNGKLLNNDSKQNSLLANPDLDLDDRGLSDNKLLHLSNAENEDMYSDLTMLFHETVTSLEENFNEELCKLKAKKNKKNKNNNKNKKEDENKIYENKIEIEEEKDIPLVFDLDQLKKLEPLERIKKIMDIINKTNNK